MCAAVRLRSINSCCFDVFVNCSLMFLDSILEFFLLVMQGTVTLIPPEVPGTMNEDL